MAQSATCARGQFLFRDASGARLDGRPLVGPRIRLEPSVEVASWVAQGAVDPSLAAGKALDSGWLREHLHWFAGGRRGLVVRPEYRDAFERLVDAREAG